MPRHWVAGRRPSRLRQDGTATTGTPRAAPRTHARPRALAALLAGALPVLTFPAPGLWWFAYVALVPWMLLLRSAPTGRRAALEGWLGGVGFVVAVHHWLMPSLHVFIVVLGALLGLLWLPWGVLVRVLLGGRPTVPRALAAVAVLPSGWLMVELARSWEGLGGPWGLLGSSQWDVTAALRLASLGGVWLVTLLVVAVNTGVVILLTLPHARNAALCALLACAVLTGAAWAWAPRPAPDRTARIAVVQPGVFDGIGSTEQRLARGEELTRTLADRRVDLVVWGESSVGEDLTARPDVAARIAALSRAVDAYVLVNVDARRSDRPGIFKSSVLVGPDGPTGARYDKMRLVPFGEYVPARALLGWATSVGKAAGEDRMRGTAPVVMELPNGLRPGPLVCFESAFPDMSRRLVRDGAGLLIAQSATSTFQDSWAPGQHATLAALRAAETGRPMVHATLTGVSSVYGPDGRRIGQPLGTDRSAAAVYDVPLAKGLTPYARFGDWAVYLAMAVLALLLAAEGVRSLRKPAPELSVPRARTARE
ncbi:apolipoprotein N-acyltransferase [Streptomyces spiroverticillatus]|uniref:Apolipoprotein N-acyltransferase n=1 Tax=Streptomyces finlayi TaxID=67296 RepID=A0A918X3U0_9ACTN|nr:apolipoprotein N-acyltransferase [Streptomyces finlayi]GHA28491.1 apolipoprotein N-acyltransferase [Streptomyces spiroverticillatus]GHD09175.1 apolipoprotein N-acyltransferase [Streptomyces finlayi]